MNNQLNTFRYLSAQQLEQPVLAFEEFFDYFDLPATYHHLWHFAKAWMSSEYADGLTARQRGEIVFFYERLGALMEAAFLVRKPDMPAPVVAFKTGSAA